MTRLVYVLHKIIHRIYQLGIPIIPWVLNRVFIRLLFGCQIGVQVTLGKNVVLGYGGLGIVIHHKATIGNNVVIGPNVTIGGSPGKHGAPVIEDNVFIGAGARILGPIRIGKNSIIGANAVVLRDVPDNAKVVGVPSRIVD